MSQKKFVSLHNHTGFSTFDGLGYPDEHINFAIENGLDAHAITEHGHMNSYAHSQLYYEKLKKSGKNFKYIPGVEAYFHPNLILWQQEKKDWDEKKNDAKEKKKTTKKIKEEIQTEIILKRDEDDEVNEVEIKNSLTIENEDETKNIKHFNPVNRRHHLVILPKNSDGLKKIFHLVSRGYLEGFFRFPRIDAKMLKEAAVDRNIIISTACLGGLLSYQILSEVQKTKQEDINHSVLNDKILLEKCLNSLGNGYDILVDAVGIENCFLELQFNKLPVQNLVNRVILEFANRNNLNNKLIVAGDSHYSRPEHWREREIYKKLGYLNYSDFTPDSLPKTKDELKCELFPKNYNQIWDSYLESKSDAPFYDDNIIDEAINRTHDIAHNLIGDISPDKKIKIPTSLIPKGKTAVSVLTEYCLTGLKEKGLSNNLEYVNRLKYELNVIKKLDFAEYFITLKKILDLARERTLVGAGRGSGAGSLVNYLLSITDVDPIKWNLLFERFLSVHRKGFPDIDSDVGDRDIVLNLLRNEFGNENVVPISNYNTFKLKTLIKDISRFYGIEFDEVNAAVKDLDKEVMSKVLGPGDDKASFVLTYDDALKHCERFKNFIDKYPKIGESVHVLFKQNKALSRHAGGVLVCDNLPKIMPLITSAGEPQTPWVEGLNFRHLEEVGGFIKYDILGLGTLRLFERTIELILKRKSGKKIKIELENGQVLNLFENDKIKLVDNSIKFAKDLNSEDEIKFPLEIEKSYEN